MDFESIIAALEPLTVAGGMLGATAIYAQVRFALWAGPKVARFFIMRRLR